jgi:tetratricopeptide (TPR) repeat protein
MEPVDTYRNDPLYVEAMEHFQRGKWEAGLKGLASLLENYPLDHELRMLNQEMQLRAKVDRDEVQDRAEFRRRLLFNYLSRALMVLLFGLLLFFSVRTYAGWISNQWDFARQAVEQEARELELAVKYNNARSLLQANRPQEAMVLAGEIEALSPDFQYLEDLKARAEELLAMESQYNQARILLTQGDTAGGLMLLRELEARTPNYRDVRSLIDTIERGYTLEELYIQANDAYDAGRWEAAIAGYEKVRALDANFQGSIVEDRLFHSYLNNAEALLRDPSGNYEAFEAANMYYRLALTLRPQNAQVLAAQAAARTTVEDRLINSYIDNALAALEGSGDSLEALNTAEQFFTRALNIRPADADLRLRVNQARNYLSAVSHFDRANWNESINLLEDIYTEDPGYASGTARQLLYEAYMSRGATASVVGDYFSALSDFQRAGAIAFENQESLLRLFQAQVKVAEMKGRLGEYEDAVRTYQAALEQIDIGFRVRQDNPGLASALAAAENLANNLNYRQAYIRYRDTLANSVALYDVVTYQVQEGDYLASLARRFNTTIEAIASANQIDNPNKILTGQTLIIPSLSPVDDETGE